MLLTEMPVFFSYGSQKVNGGLHKGMTRWVRRIGGLVKLL